MVAPWEAFSRLAPEKTAAHVRPIHVHHVELFHQEFAAGKLWSAGAGASLRRANWPLIKAGRRATVAYESMKQIVGLVAHDASAPVVKIDN